MGSRRPKEGLPKPVAPSRSIASDERAQRIARSGMIQPGAKPQFDRDTPLDHVARGARKVISAVKQATKRRSK